MSKQNFSMFKSEEELEDMEKTVETNSKKNLVIVPEGRYGLFKIQWDDGRSLLPKELSGQYTSQGFAEKAIKTYVANHRTTKRLEKQERDEARDEMIRRGGIKNEQPSEKENITDQAEEKEEEVEKDISKVEKDFS